MSHKKFYEVREGVNYDEDSKRQKKELHNSLETMYKTIKKEIGKSTLKNYLVMAQQNGFGLYINYYKPEIPTKTSTTTQSE